MPDIYGRHPRMTSIGQRTNHELSHSIPIIVGGLLAAGVLLASPAPTAYADNSGCEPSASNYVQCKHAAQEILPQDARAGLTPICGVEGCIPNPYATAQAPVTTPVRTP
jgi:hypothetical protein